MLLEVSERLGADALERVVGRLLVHHDALRLRFLPSDSGWQQISSAPDETVPFTRVDLSGVTDPELAAAVERAAGEIQQGLDLTEGPLLRAAYFDLGAGRPGRLLLVIHHLAVDGVSWRILLADLQEGCLRASRGEEIEFPPKTTSFKHWARGLTEYARSGELREEVEYWADEKRVRAERLPVDYEGGAGTEASSRVVTTSLGAEETQALLHQIPAAYHTQINDILVAALVRVLAKWAGGSHVLVDLEGHGREAILEDADVSRTVGWFTSIFPVLFEVGAGEGPGETLKSVKEHLRLLPRRGVGYGILRYLTEDAEVSARLKALPPAEVSFNYLGQFDQVVDESPDSLFRGAREATGPTKSPLSGRTHLLGVGCMVAGGRLRVNWEYGEDAHRHATVEGLAEKYVAALRELIAHCQSGTGVSYTPSDFSKMKMSQEELDELMRELEEETTGS